MRENRFCLTLPSPSTIDAKKHKYGQKSLIEIVLLYSYLQLRLGRRSIPFQSQKVKCMPNAILTTIQQIGHLQIYLSNNPKTDSLHLLNISSRLMKIKFLLLFLSFSMFFSSSSSSSLPIYNYISLGRMIVCAYDFVGTHIIPSYMLHSQIDMLYAY